MLAHPRNGDLVKWWVEDEAGEGHKYGTVDMAITHPGGYWVRVIDDNGNMHEMNNTELIARCRYINVYSVERNFGGPEEGGWYYDSGEPVASVPYWNEHDGQRIRHELEERYTIPEREAEKQGRRHGRGSVLGGADHQVVSEDEFAHPYPTERPHYE